jgi:hypothetical protein
LSLTFLLAPFVALRDFDVKAGMSGASDVNFATEKQAAFKRDKWKCRHCEIRNELHPHHVQYQSHNGPDTRQNLLTLCCQCHAAVHAVKLVIFVAVSYIDNTVRDVRMTGRNREEIEKDNVKFVRIGWKPK